MALSISSWPELDGDLIVKVSPKPVPDALKSRVGEFANLVRSALNFLVHETAATDYGKAQRGTQFPITDDPGEFARLKPRYLKGVTDPHAAAIEAVQPYNGGDWLALIRDLSNIDKHRELAPVASAVQKNLRSYRIERSAAAETHAREITPGVTEVDVDVNVHLGISYDVQLGNGERVIRALDVLHTQAAKFVEEFEAAF